MNDLLIVSCPLGGFEAGPEYSDNISFEFALQRRGNVYDVVGCRRVITGRPVPKFKTYNIREIKALTPGMRNRRVIHSWSWYAAEALNHYAKHEGADRA